MFRPPAPLADRQGAARIYLPLKPVEEGAAGRRCVGSGISHLGVQRMCRHPRLQGTLIRGRHDPKLTQPVDPILDLPRVKDQVRSRLASPEVTEVSYRPASCGADRHSSW